MSVYGEEAGLWTGWEKVSKLSVIKGGKKCGGLVYFLGGKCW